MGRTGGVYELSMTYQFNLDKNALAVPITMDDKSQYGALNS
jgi:hypothetical protein